MYICFCKLIYSTLYRVICSLVLLGIIALYVRYSKTETIFSFNSLRLSSVLSALCRLFIVLSHAFAPCQWNLLLLKQESDWLRDEYSAISWVFFLLKNNINEIFTEHNLRVCVCLYKNNKHGVKNFSTDLHWSQTHRKIGLGIRRTLDKAQPLTCIYNIFWNYRSAASVWKLDFSTIVRLFLFSSLIFVCAHKWNPFMKIFSPFNRLHATVRGIPEQLPPQLGEHICNNMYNICAACNKYYSDVVVLLTCNRLSTMDWIVLFQYCKEFFLILRTERAFCLWLKCLSPNNFTQRRWT